ncbi:hypothetical protein H8E88_02850 [candidate division KSB1 bacterium]|nr:hypothetical protein [candidate division KSB1 bacterium]
MNNKTITFFLVVFLLLTTSTFSKVNRNNSSTDSSFKYSIGVDNTPWDAYNVSIRFWKNQTINNMLTIGRGTTTITTKDDTVYLDNYNVTFRIDRFNRQPFGKNNTLKFWVIIGKGVDFSVSFRDYTHSPGRSASDSKYYTINFHYIRGIEHFLFKDIPNISYSIYADFYTGIRFSQPPNAYYKNMYTLSFGLKPTFYLWYHFK